VRAKTGFALLCAIAFFSFYPQLSFPEKYLDYQNPQIKSLLSEGIDASFREDYAKAESKFRKLIEMAPSDPAGYFFLAALYHAQMIDHESDFREEEFYRCVKAAKKRARNRIKQDKEDAWAYLVLGNSYGAKAVYEAKKGNWLSGLDEGLRAKSTLKEAVKRNPELFDAYVGLGSYHFWASEMTKVLWWLPFIGDNREQGISEMKTAYQKSTFSQAAAASGLIWMYIRLEEYDQAISLARKMQNRYPEGKSFLWGLAEAYYDKRDLNNALLNYQDLLRRLEENHRSENPGQSYNLIECRFYIANCLLGLGRYAECDSVCQEILDSPLEEKIRQRQKNKLDRARKLQERCSELTGGKG
jgi:tetratricopeptide (TPR) repeat protein